MVRQADHPALGLCLDSFHILSRGSDPARIREIPGDRIFYLQLADALPADWTGAVTPDDVSFVEIAVDSDSGPAIANALAGLGFGHSAHHRTKPVQLWEQNGARILLNTGDTRPGGAITALGFRTPDPDHAGKRAEAMLSPPIRRTLGPAEADLPAITAPDGTEIFFCGPDEEWIDDFVRTGAGAPSGHLRQVDHVALTEPFDVADEAALFCTAVLRLQPANSTEIAAPFGLMRTTVFRSAPTDGRTGGGIRLALTSPRLRRGPWAPEVTSPQHIAFATDDLFSTAQALRDRGVALLRIPDNYYDDLEARLNLDGDQVSRMREFGILADADDTGLFLHLYTPIRPRSRLFFAIVQRTGGYQGCGAADAAIRMAAHRHARSC